jgi:hypothetical protein
MFSTFAARFHAFMHLPDALAVGGTFVAYLDAFPAEVMMRRTEASVIVLLQKGTTVE